MDSELGSPHKAQWILRIAVAAQCFALGFIHLFSSTPINDFLVMRVSGNAANLVDQLAGLSLIVLSGVILARPLRSVLLIVSAWFLWFAVATWLTHFSDEDRIFYQLAPAAQAVRYLSPIALVFLLAKRTRIALWLLAIATAGTFIGHGVKDVLHYAPYVDLINNTLDRFFGTTWPLERTQSALRIIGCADIAAAVLLLFTRWRLVAFAMAAWGLVAALSRVTAGGWGSWPECLLRICNAAAPLVLFYLIAYTVRQSKADPEQEWEFNTPANAPTRGTVPGRRSKRSKDETDPEKPSSDIYA